MGPGTGARRRGRAGGRRPGSSRARSPRPCAPSRAAVASAPATRPRAAGRRPSSGDALALLADVVDQDVLAQVLRLDVKGTAAVDTAHQVDELRQVPGALE